MTALLSWRTHYGLGQTQLADAAGWHRSDLGRYERGERTHFPGPRIAALSRATLELVPSDPLSTDQILGLAPWEPPSAIGCAV